MSDKSSFLQILLSYHKPAVLVDNAVCTPVHTGRAEVATKDGVMTAGEQAWLRQNTSGDDSGDNVSRLGPQFNELTTQYWAWKNCAAIGNPEYVGFMQYRRHFPPLSGRGAKAAYIMREYATPKHLAELSEDNFRQALEGADAVFPPLLPLPFPIYDAAEPVVAGAKNRFNNVLSMLTPRVPDFMDRLTAVATSGDPEWRRAWDAFLAGRDFSVSNLFIMRRELFFRYSEWLFGVMLHPDLRMAEPGVHPWRAAVLVSEYLLGAFRMKLELEGAKTGLLSTATFLRNDITEPLRPANPERPRAVIAIADDTQAPGLAEFFSSLAAAAPEAGLDILVLGDGVGERNRRRLAAALGEKARLRFSNAQFCPPELIEFYPAGYDAADLFKLLFLPGALPHFDQAALLSPGAPNHAEAAELLAADIGDRAAVFSKNGGAVLLDLRRLREIGFAARCLALLGRERGRKALARAICATLGVEGMLPGAGDDDAIPLRSWNRSLAEAATPPGEKSGCPARLIATNRQTFAAHRDACAGRDLVLIGDGPEAAAYRPRPGAVHVGTGRAFALAPDVAWDYLLVTPDYLGDGRNFERDADLFAPLSGKARLGAFCVFSSFPDKIRENGVMLGAAARRGIGVAYMRHRTWDACSRRPEFVHDIDADLLEIAGSGNRPVLLALQFALFTRPARVFLVGCGVPPVGDGGDELARLARGRLAADWLEMADFIRGRYPDVAVHALAAPGLETIFPPPAGGGDAGEAT